MKAENALLDKSYNFAIRIVNLYKFLTKEKKDYIIAKQIFRSGTSIGANAEEAVGGFSDKDFIAKLQISYKETRETRYWLRLLRDTDYLSKEQATSLINDCEELQKIITAILNTMKGKSNS